MIYGQPITFSGASAPKLFGDGSDGAGLFASSTTWLAETEDTGMIVKNFESLTISEGVTVAAGNRNCGMIIRVKGNCTIHGSLVNKMACKTLLDSDNVDFSAYPASMLKGVAGNGGAGGTYTGGAASAAGAGMAGRFYGGGYSGGGCGYKMMSHYTNDGGSAADITTAVTSIFVGGKGQGSSPTAGQYGGGGGAYYGSNGGNGPGGHAGTTNNEYGHGGGGAGNYGGGVIILLVGGKLTITGTIDCSGGTGGNGASSGNLNENYGAGGGGGGGGGGRIFICHKGAIENTGTLNVNGGAGGAGGSARLGSGTAGTAGTIGTTAVKTYQQYKAEDVA